MGRINLVFEGRFNWIDLVLDWEKIVFLISLSWPNLAFSRANLVGHAEKRGLPGLAGGR
jgi:hypothetical protein